jgi:hypothetical protein
VGCFRHQLLLGRHPHCRNTKTDSPERFEEQILHSRKTIFDEKISLSVSALLVNPACQAGVLTALPNLSALWGLMKLYKSSTQNS